MSIASALGLTSATKIRYAIVGLGDISQAAMMPGIDETGNSEIAALVTSDSVKADVLGKQYDVDLTCDYDGFDTLIHSGMIDAIYLGTPNWWHAEFILPALRAGIHVLTEKPLEISVARCEEIVAAQRASKAKLMVAYRLHFEPATLAAIRRIRDGELGELVLFSACFTQFLDPANHRAKNGVLAGPLLDMGPYPINAARYLFGEEPIEVATAAASRHPNSGFADLDDTLSVTLRFPGNRLAQFVISYFANGVDSLVVSGTKGSLQMNPAFRFKEGLAFDLTIGEKKTHETFKATNQFAGEMRYFSDCILNGHDPEPDAEEGLADLRVVEGILNVLKTGRPQKLAPFRRKRRIDVDRQSETLAPHKPPKLVNAHGPSKD